MIRVCLLVVVTIILFAGLGCGLVFLFLLELLTQPFDFISERFLVGAESFNNVEQLFNCHLDAFG